MRTQLTVKRFGSRRIWLHLIVAILFGMPTKASCQNPDDHLPPVDPTPIGFDRSHTAGYEGSAMMFDLSAPRYAKSFMQGPIALNCTNEMTAYLQRPRYRLHDPVTIGAEYVNIASAGSTFHSFSVSLNNAEEGWSASYGYFFGPVIGHALSLHSEFQHNGGEFKKNARFRRREFEKLPQTTDGEFRSRAPDEIRSQEALYRRYEGIRQQSRAAYAKYVRSTIPGWNADWAAFPTLVQDYSLRLYLYSMVTHVDLDKNDPSITQTMSLGPAYRHIYGFGDHMGGRITYSIRWQDRTPSSKDTSNWRARLGISLIGQSFEGYKAQGGAFITADIKDARSGLSVFGAVGVGLNERQVVSFGVHLGPDGRHKSSPIGRATSL